jgi:pimeloyl-ACP methyl ester carboxylesterase
VYQPLAAALSDRFVVWGLDLPGHGTAAGVQLSLTRQLNHGHGASSPNGRGVASGNSSSSGHSGADSFTPITLPGVTQYVIDTIHQAGLSGCYAFGHSAGGAVALLAASQCPQLFQALYCFEAVVSTPSTHTFMAAATASGDIQTDGQVLGSMARKRRAVFDSRAAAQQHLTSKPPFSRLDRQAVSLYVQHGFVEVPAVLSGTRQAQGLGLQGLLQEHLGQHGGTQQHTGQPQMQPAQHQQKGQLGNGSQLQSRALHQNTGQSNQQQQQQQQQLAVHLVCSPQQEAAYFDALQPPPAVNPHSLHCPVLLAVAAPPPGSGAAPAAALSSHEGVKAWLYEQSSSTKRQLHGVLRVLNVELAAAMLAARLQEVPGVTHFGPLEQPQQLADSCAEFFELTCSSSSSSSKAGQQQQQLQPQPKVASKL